MTVPRPLMHNGVKELEQMFVRGKGDPKVLKQLESELQYRQVPRAVALLAEVQAAMYGGAVAPQVLAMPTVPTHPAVRTPAPAQVPAAELASQQPNLWEPPAAPPTVATPRVAPVRAAISVVKPPEAPPVATRSPAFLPAMPLDEACKILKTTPGATWETIEPTRQALVQQSHPLRWKALTAEKRAQVLAEARRVNAAYAALSQARCGGRPTP